MRPCWVLALLFIDLGEHPVGVQRRYPLGDLERQRPGDDGSITFRKANRIALVRSAAGKPLSRA